jgi:hypothetical protein
VGILKSRYLMKILYREIYTLCAVVESGCYTLKDRESHYKKKIKKIKNKNKKSLFSLAFFFKKNLFSGNML